MYSIRPLAVSALLSFLVAGSEALAYRSDIPTPPWVTSIAPPAPTGTPGPAPPSDASISEDGLNLIKELEGYRAEFYILLGEEHIGYGHNCDQLLDCEDIEEPMSEEEADELLDEDLADYEACVCALPNSPELNLSQYSALVSFAFNAGCGALDESAPSYMEAVDFEGICNDIIGWATLDGFLDSRRVMESDLCFAPTEEMSGC